MDYFPSLNVQHNCAFILGKDPAVQLDGQDLTSGNCVICQNLYCEDMMKCELCPRYAHESCVLGAYDVIVLRDTLADFLDDTFTNAEATAIGTTIGSIDTASAGTQARSVDVSPVAGDVVREDTVRAFPEANAPVNYSRMVPAASPARLLSMRSQAVRPRMLPQLSPKTSWVAPVSTPVIRQARRST